MRNKITVLAIIAVTVVVLATTAVTHATIRPVRNRSAITAPAPSTSSSVARAAPLTDRYLHHVFSRVNVTRDVVYGHAIDHADIDEALRLDIYQPARDLDRQRAAIVWLHPGGFTTGSKSAEASYATDFARRGYVSIAIDYRLRPNMQWFDMAQRPYAAGDAYDDATMAIRWIRGHAAAYGIDRTLVFAAGYSAGAITTLEVASPPDGGPSLVAGAMSIAGYEIGTPRAGQPPRLVFHGTHDWLVPYSLDLLSCAEARNVGDRCQLVTFTDGLHDIGFARFGPIVEQTARFFSAIVGQQVASERPN